MGKTADALIRRNRERAAIKRRRLSSLTVYRVRELLSARCAICRHYEWDCQCEENGTH